MLFQVGISSFLILTRMVYYAYSILRPPMNSNERVIAAFLTAITILLYYANYAKSFYIYTLSSRLFRSILIERINTFLKIIPSKNSTLPAALHSKNSVENSTRN